MQNIFLELVKLSFIGSLFAAAVMLVRLIFRKAPKWLFCILWGVVALRLICPVSIESDVSLIPDSLATGQIITNVGNEYIGDVDIIYESNTGYNNAIEAGRQPINSDEGYYVVTEKNSLEAPKTVGETVYPILSWVWAVGMVLMLAYTAVSFLVLGKKMEEATHLRDNIWQCEQADSPFVLGFIKPRIYLPYGITDSDMANVIAHEQAHIQRRDHWWKPVGFLLLSIYWFNPVLWLAYILLCRDIEAACDEKVIKHMEKDEMRAYSTALLHCSIHRRRIAACPLAFGEVGVKERVKSVMNYKKPAFWIIVTAVISCIVVAVCFMTNPVSNTLNYIEHNDFYAVTQENTTVLISDGEPHTYAGAVERDKMQELYDIEISEKEVSQNRSEDRDKTNSLYLNLSSQEEQEILTSYAPGIWIHFNADFTQVWVEDGVKPTLSYKVLKPEQARSVYLSFTNKTTDNEPVETIKGGLKTYYKNADGTWQLNGRTYQYRLEITGRMPNAAVDSTFVYLSNIKSISFARAWRAAGLSSSMEDYFSEEEAVLVDWTSGDSSSETIESDEDYVIKTDRLNGAIADAILSHHKKEKPDGLLNTESHIILVNEAVSGTPL